MKSVLSVFNKKHQWSHQTRLSVKSVLSVFNKKTSVVRRSFYFAFYLQSIVMTEVVEKPEFVASSFEVVIDLAAMRVLELGDGFEFHNDIIEANEISAVGLLEFLTVVVYLQFLLSLERDASLGQFYCECFLIDCFQKSWT